MSRVDISESDWEVFNKVAQQLGLDLPQLSQEGVRFCEMEAAGHAIGRAVACATTERLSLSRMERVPDVQPCPTCGKACAANAKDRELLTGDGKIQLSEPVAHCSACRRDFFPSASGVGIGAICVQSDGDGQDRLRRCGTQVDQESTQDADQAVGNRCA